MYNLSSNERSYFEEFNNAFNNTNRINLFDLLGKHAANMIDMAIKDRANKKRDIMDSWVKIDKINTNWIKILCPVSSNNSHDYKFKNITKKLIRGYSDVLGDYIIDGIFDEKHHDEIIKATVEYYNTLSKHGSKRESDKIEDSFRRYTSNIKQMVDNLDIHGKDNGHFFTKARECIISANLLGSQLHSSVF